MKTLPYTPMTPEEILTARKAMRVGAAFLFHRAALTQQPTKPATK